MELSLRVVVSVKKPVDLTLVISEFEKEALRLALIEAKGIKAHAAKMLMLKRTTLVEKLRKHGFMLENAAR